VDGRRRAGRSCATLGLDARPQVPITTGGVEIHPDVVDVDRRIVLEAERVVARTAVGANAA